LVDYIFQLTPEEQRRVASAMGKTRATNDVPAKKKNAAAQAPPAKQAGYGGSR
jgi:hypothetical protein